MNYLHWVHEPILAVSTFNIEKINKNWLVLTGQGPDWGTVYPVSEPFSNAANGYRFTVALHMLSGIESKHFQRDSDYYS
ncbi:hypothetical protein CDAR_560611 [Caerostris darwini]|uniref:Uncharacterized protein n=1 Tax=Caerostris darwini TaxID=1538125 RepID=A0AAV4W6M2_9ARAC|nr:hypothetical protein CDAR_560611 [Caerostris darwini]